MIDRSKKKGERHNFYTVQKLQKHLQMIGSKKKEKRDRRQAPGAYKGFIFFFRFIFCLFNWTRDTNDSTKHQW